MADVIERVQSGELRLMSGECYGEKCDVMPTWKKLRDMRESSTPTACPECERLKGESEND